MNDSPGWASPGSSPSDEPGRSKPAPTPPFGSGGGPGWGGPGGGWGSGWAQPPAVAKPGIIPLRPLGVGEILDGAVSAMRAHWRTVLGISLTVAVVTQVAATVATGIWFRDSTSLEGLENNPNPTPDEIVDAFSGSMGNAGVTSLIGMLGTIIATAMLTIVVSRAVLGRSVSTAESWRDSRAQLARLCGLLLLLPLLIVGVAAAGLLPGLLVSAAGNSEGGAALVFLGGFTSVAAAVWLWIRYSLAAPTLMLEKQGVFASLHRSAKLVRGAWWRVFGIQLLTLILVFLVSAVIEIPTGILAMIVGGEGALDWLSGEAVTPTWTFLVVAGIGAVISSTVTFPISAGVTALLYIDQRIRREALDLELARAAGVAEYGAQQPGIHKTHDTTPGG